MDVFKSFYSRLIIQIFTFISLALATGSLVAFGYETDLHPGADSNNLLVAWQSWWALLSALLAMVATAAVYRAHERDVSASRRRTSQHHPS